MEPPYIPGECPRTDAVQFARRLPMTPKTAVDATTYAARWGVRPDYMLAVLRAIPDAVRTDGWLNPATGLLVYDAWYREWGDGGKKFGVQAG